MEKGEATHLFAVDPRKIKSGEVPIEEVPYMQRAGGAWDGSDLKGAALRRAKKKQSQGMYTAGRWLDSDREYEKNGPGVMSFFTQFNGGKQDKVEVLADRMNCSPLNGPIKRRIFVAPTRTRCKFSFCSQTLQSSSVCAGL